MGTRSTILAGLVVFLAASLAGAAAPPDAPLSASADNIVALGKRIYRDGILPDGSPARAVVQPGVTLTGLQAACTTCHRRSGLGSPEGTTTSRPITGPSLFRPRESFNWAAGRTEGEASGTPRSAYTDETLAHAIRDGLDPTGRPLSPLMPRYPLDGETLSALVAYLKTIGLSPAPGIDETTVRFATVLAEGIPPTVRQGVLDVLTAFIHDRNANTRGETRRAALPRALRARKFKAYRQWALDAWNLTGPRETWPAQLEAYYRRRPVFAVISGAAPGNWGPVHAFCERLELPCLFPLTEQPAVSETDFYTVYFSRGLTLQADVLAAHLASDPAATAGPILQVIHPGDAEGALSLALRTALRRHGVASLRDLALGAAERLTAEAWTALFERERPARLVLWSADPDLAPLAQAAGPLPDRLYLRSTPATRRPEAIPTSLRTRVRLVHPYDLPDTWGRRLQQVQPWLKSRGIANGDEPVQASVYLAARVAGEAFMHLRDYFSRELFLERIEHGLESALMTSVYPRLSLGPGQRYASKGAYILRPGATKGSWTPEGDWIVP
jgi:hypothetical protein